MPRGLPPAHIVRMAVPPNEHMVNNHLPLTNKPLLSRQAHGSIVKTLIHFFPSLPHKLNKPLARTALPFFFTLAFLPGILRLVLPELPAMNPLAALCPMAAGFWLAAGLREIRMHFALLGIFLTTLLWAANWLMLAGHGCCSTM